MALSDGRFDQSIVAPRPNPNLGFATALDFRGFRPITLRYPEGSGFIGIDFGAIARKNKLNIINDLEQYL